MSIPLFLAQVVIGALILSLFLLNGQNYLDSFKLLHLVLLIRQLIKILLLSLCERQPVSETLVTQMLIPISEGCDVCVISLITTEAGYVHSIFIYLLIIRVHLSIFLMCLACINMRFSQVRQCCV